jgi:hypothetical protein
MRRKYLYILFICSVALSSELSATSLSGSSVNLNKDQIQILDKIACANLAKGTLNEVNAWSFDEKVACDVKEMVDTYQGIKIYKCNNFSSEWQCDFFSSEIKRDYPKPTGAVYINTSSLHSSEGIEVVDNLTNKISLNKVITKQVKDHHCTVDQSKLGSYDVICDEEKVFRILKSCRKGSCIWKVFYNGLINN